MDPSSTINNNTIYLGDHSQDSQNLPVKKHHYAYLQNPPQNWSDLTAPTKFLEKTLPWVFRAALVAIVAGTVLGIIISSVNHHSGGIVLSAFMGPASIVALGWAWGAWWAAREPARKLLSEGERDAEIKKLASSSLGEAYARYRFSGKYEGSLIPVVKGGTLSPDEADDLNTLLDTYENADEARREELDQIWRAMAANLEIMQLNQIDTYQKRSEAEELQAIAKSAQEQFIREFGY